MVVDATDVSTVAVVGAGQMGRGIGAVAALAEYDVVLNDIDESQLEEARERIDWSYDKGVEKGTIDKAAAEAAMDRIRFTTDQETAVTDAEFVTEAAAEQQSLKENIFADLDELVSNETILATNTSGLNITEIAEATERPSRVVGTHWFNPPMLMDLVEIISTEHMDDSTAATAEAVVESFGKTPIRCKMDIPGFIVNRLMRPYFEAPAWMLHRGEHGIVEIDSAMKYKEGFPMGPFELEDFTGGIQLRAEGQEDHLTDDRPMSYETEACPIVYQLYEKGRYGRKADAGYYDYSDQDEPDIPVDAGKDVDPLSVWAPIVNEAAKLVQNDVATVEDIDTGARLGGNWPTGPLKKCDEVGPGVILQRVTDLASRYENADKRAERLPCDLLVEKAVEGQTFY